MKTLKPLFALLLVMVVGCAGSSATAGSLTPSAKAAPTAAPPPKDQTTVRVIPPGTPDSDDQPELTKRVKLSDIPPFADARDLGAVYELIRKVHITSDATDKELYYGAIKGMVKALKDPFTHFLDPKEAKAARDSMNGNFVGVGIKLDTKEGTLKVSGTMSGSPAEAAGIKPGDVVVEVDGKPTKGEEPEVSISRIRGEPGTKVNVTVLRKDAPRPITFALTRAQINTPSVHWKMLNSGGKTIELITIDQFGSDTSRLFVDALKAGRAAKASGIVLDLRNNGGGLLRAAGAVSCMWIANEPYTILGGRRDGQKDDALMCGSNAPMEDVPTAVLVNGNSASASEITAGALQDFGKARVFGETTYGKGCGQDVIDLPDGAQFVVVSFLWYTPHRRSIHKKGITPDEIIKADPADLAKGKDVQLDRALQYLVTGH